MATVSLMRQAEEKERENMDTITDTVLGADVKAGDVLLRDGRYLMIYDVQQPEEPAVVVQAWATGAVRDNDYDSFLLAFGVGARFRQVCEHDGVRVLADRWGK